MIREVLTASPEGYALPRWTLREVQVPASQYPGEGADAMRMAGRGPPDRRASCSRVGHPELPEPGRCTAALPRLYRERRRWEVRDAEGKDSDADHTVLRRRRDQLRGRRRRPHGRGVPARLGRLRPVFRLG